MCKDEKGRIMSFNGVGVCNGFCGNGCINFILKCYIKISRIFPVYFYIKTTSLYSFLSSSIPFLYKYNKMEYLVAYAEFTSNLLAFFFANTVLLDSNIIWVNGTMNKMLRSRIYYEYFRSNLVVMGMFLFGAVNHRQVIKRDLRSVILLCFMILGWYYLGEKDLVFIGLQNRNIFSYN